MCQQSSKSPDVQLDAMDRCLVPAGGLGEFDEVAAVA